MSSLDIKTDGEAGVACLRLSGIIDEKFDANAILDQVQPLTILEVSGVKRITSFGVRQWTEAMKALPATVKHLYLVRCPPVFVDQLSMVLNFAGRCEVVSAFAALVCDKCGDELDVLLDFFGDRARISAGQLAEAQCKKCNLAMQLADDPHTYQRLVNDFGAKTIEAPAASLMERSGIHALKRVGRPPEATKLVHEQITLFRLSGTLDGRFRQRRVASGVEGDVIFDLADIEGLDAAGAERWRELLGELSSAISITIVDVPELLLPAIADGTFSVKGVGLHSYQASFQCADCGNLEQRSVRADEPLGASTRACPRCGRDATPATDVALVEEVMTRSRPAAVKPAIEAMIRDRAEILSRARAESGTTSQAAAATDSLARYRVIKPLSEGGMAEIFLAVHQGIAGFEKLVVLKKILRKMLERRQVAVQLFLNEAKIAANLNHPNIVQTFEVGEHGGDLYIAMEYIHGVDLRRLLRQTILKQEMPPLEQLLYVAERVAAALHHAHTAKDLTGRSLNIVHRDVSLSNVILGFDGQVKLLDFGVASAAVGESFEGVIGKFSYMSPEQLAREALDGRSDVFALGVVMYELISRRPLFRRNNDHDTIRAVLHHEIVPLTTVPDYVSAVIMKALSRKRDDRYSDARALQLALEECIRRLGNLPTHDKLADMLTRLFPEQSAAPAFDPSLYRPHDSPSPSTYASASGSGRSSSSSSSSPPEDELTLVNADTSGVVGIPAEAVADALEAAKTPTPPPARTPTPPPARTPAPLPPKTPTPAPQVSTPAPTPTPTPTPAPTPTPTPSRPMPLIPPAPMALQALPPLTPSPRTRPPSLTGIPILTPPPLQPTTPLPEALQNSGLTDRKRGPRSDYWLIAAAVVVFIIGFLLVMM